MSKYQNRKFSNEFGTFDSQLEYYRYLMLLEKQKNGTIRKLQRQVEFELIPAQYMWVPGKVNKEGIPVAKRKLAERACCYIADFVYEVQLNWGWETIIEDTKGYHTKDYIIKRKLMRYQHHAIREVKTPNEPII